jgi:catechol 2,3-dioxygenase-like lactoylglutathione lyase family enzyme
MERTCSFYSKIPGFSLVYGGNSNDVFSTFQIGVDLPREFLNFELKSHRPNELGDYNSKIEYGRLIFQTDDVDKLFSYFESNKWFSEYIILENKPTNATWGERYFHLRDPEGFQLSFAQPL